MWWSSGSGTSRLIGSIRYQAGVQRSVIWFKELVITWGQYLNHSEGEKRLFRMLHFPRGPDLYHFSLPSFPHLILLSLSLLLIFTFLSLSLGLKTFNTRCPLKRCWCSNSFWGLTSQKIWVHYLYQSGETEKECCKSLRAVRSMMLRDPTTEDWAHLLDAVYEI